MKPNFQRTVFGLALSGAMAIAVSFLPLLFAVIVLTGRPQVAQALPSFARQTGQPCSACHTSFPELTPFGRRFKLGGYTLGAPKPFTAFPPLAAMVQGGFTHTAKKQSAPPASGFDRNNNFSVDQVSAFYGGAITEQLGAFIQGTLDGVENASALDNTDMRFAHDTTVLGRDVTLGIDVNNNPTVQDVWNTTPAWGWPQFASGVAPEFSPPGTVFQEALGGQVVGVSGYLFFNDMLYVEGGGYIPLSHGAQTAIGTLGDNKLDQPAPYGRLALESTRDNMNLMIGGFIMAASQKPGWVSGFGTDDTIDFGADAQFQYMGDTDSVTLKLSNIYERMRLHSSFAQGAASSVDNHLNVFNASATWVHDKVYSLQAGFFGVWGSRDALLYGDSAKGSPNSSGITLDASYSPFMDGGPDAYKTFNIRMGVQYAHYFKLFGSSSNFDGASHNAADNDTVWLYTVAAF